MNVPPPFCTAWTGKRKKFPKPTAFPAIAKMSPTREPHASVDFAMLLSDLLE